MTEIFRERLPAFQGSCDAPELVLLHGWAASSEVWRSALPRLRRYFNITLIDLPGHGHSAPREIADARELVDLLLPLLPQRAIYIGWSLGGMLATQLAARHSERVSALITVATNAVFVAHENWPCAMPEQQFSDFRQGLHDSAGKTLRRFFALQLHGDDQEKTWSRYWRRQLPESTDAQALDQGLGWLAALDNRLALKKMACPVLHILGEQDALVPASAVDALRDLCPEHRVLGLPGVSHIPFVTEADAFWANVFGFLRDHKLLPELTSSTIDKEQVARSFSRAASTYDGVADLQRRVADQLLEHIPDGAMATRLLDLGCGTGYSLPALGKLCDELLAVDLAEGMLAYARQCPERNARAWLCADAENLPLGDDTVDVVFSSLSLQWCENLAAVFAECYRALRPGGSLVMSTLGPETLFELRKAWRAADDLVHVNEFLPRNAVEKAIARSGLSLCSWTEASEVLRYGELRGLMSELKQLGAHNLNAGRPGGLTGKRRLRRFVEAYESFRQGDGQLPATYQVWYLVLEKPVSAEEAGN